MALTTGERDSVFRAFMRLLPPGDTTPYVRSVLRTAVDDADTWAETNAAAFNTALNATFRTNASTAQKSTLLALVCWYRAGKTLPEGS